MYKNFFSEANRRFSNYRSNQVEVFRLTSEPVSNVLKAFSAIFRQIDFSDDYQRQFSRLAWKIRCKVMFSLSPFDNEELGLLADLEELSSMSRGIPSFEKDFEYLKNSLMMLIEQNENPKLEWVLKQDFSDINSVTIFALMAMRRSFGTDLISKKSINQNKNIQVLTSLKQLTEQKASIVVFPGTLRYLSSHLFMNLFYHGEFKRICLLLYENEYSSIKNRIKLPESSLFPKLSEGIKLEIKEISDFSVNHSFSSDDYEMNPADIFSSSTNLITDDLNYAWFILFDDGRGFYVSESKKLRVWREQSSDKLLYVSPQELLEGDFVIIDKSIRGEVLEYSEKRDEFLAGLNLTDVWRKPLNALLLAVSAEDISNQMIATGCISKLNKTVGMSESNDLITPFARNLKINILKWAEGQVYGPGDSDSFHALIQVLVNSGFLKIEVSPKYAAMEWFEQLETLRSKRRNAGFELSVQTESLIEKVFKEETNISDGQEFTLSNGMNVSIHRVAMINEASACTSKHYSPKIT